MDFINLNLDKFNETTNLMTTEFREVYSVFPSIIATIFLVALFLLWVNRKTFLSAFGKSSETTLFGLTSIVAVFVLICIFSGLNLKFFNPCDREWRELNVARSLLLGQRNALYQFPEKIIPSLMLAVGFGFFGFNPLIASLLNLILAVFSIILVFALTQIIFKNEIVSLFSSLVYAFSPFTLVFTSLRMGDTTTVGFFLLLSVITAVLSFRHHKLSLHVLTLAFFSLTTHTKPEYFILILPYVFCFVIFEEYVYFSPKKITALIILFFLFSLPFFISNIHFRKSYTSGWCGTPSQIFDEGLVYSYSQPITEPLDRLIRFLANRRFSINYLIYDLPNFIRFWFSKGFMLSSLFAVWGGLVAFKKYKRETLLVLLVFLSISVVYLADCIYYEARLATPSFGLIVVFSGFGINLLSEKIKKKVTNQSPKRIIGGVIILALLFSCYFDFSKFQIFPYNNYNTHNEVDVYNNLRKIINYYDLSLQKSCFMVPHENEMEALLFLGYGANCLGELIRTDYFQDRQEFFESFVLPLDQTKDNYFIYSQYCKYQKELADVCGFIVDDYVKEKIGEMNNYVIYLLKD